MNKIGNKFTNLFKRRISSSQKGENKGDGKLEDESVDSKLELSVGSSVQCIQDWPPLFQDITKRREDVKTLRSFMDILGNVTESYAKGLKKISELSSMECQTSLEESWSKIRNSALELSNHYSNTALKIQKKVMVGILECKHQIRTEHDRLQGQSTRLQSELISIQTKHDIKKKKYFEATEKAHFALAAEKKSRAEGQSQKKHERFVRERVARVKDAKIAFEKYNQSLLNLQNMQRRYVRGSNEILKQMEALEQMRIAVCSNQMKSFLEFRETAAKLEADLTNKLRHSIEKIDATQDMDCYKKRLEKQCSSLKITEYTASQYHAVISISDDVQDTASSVPNKTLSPAELKTAVAIHTFEPEESKHLKLEIGDRVTLIEAKAGASWWSGKIGDKKGLFPSYFVRKLAVIPDSEAPKMILKNGTVTKEFVGRSEEEMSVDVGDKVNVTAFGEGWYVGSKIGEEEACGIFPATHVKLL